MSQPIPLTDRQLETLRAIHTANNQQNNWRYSIPPATRFNALHLSSLVKKELIKTTPCPMYIDKKHPYTGKGVQLTPAGIQLLNSLRN